MDNNCSVVPANECVQTMNKYQGGGDIHDIEEKINTILNGETPEKIVKTVIENYPEQKDQLDSLNDYKDKYTEKNFLGKLWNKGEMQEKTNEVVFLLAKMSNSQLKLQALLVWMTNELKKQQNTIAAQQTIIKTQGNELAQNQDILKNQQLQLKKQTEALEVQGALLSEQAQRLLSENEELLQRASELKELRKIGQEHDTAIEEHDQALTGLERFLLEIKQVAKEYREDQKKMIHHSEIIAEVRKQSENNTKEISELKTSNIDIQKSLLQQNKRLDSVAESSDKTHRQQTESIKNIEDKTSEHIKKTQAILLGRKWIIIVTFVWLLFLTLGLGILIAHKYLL